MTSSARATARNRSSCRNNSQVVPGRSISLTIGTNRSLRSTWRITVVNAMTSAAPASTVTTRAGHERRAEVCANSRGRPPDSQRATSTVLTIESAMAPANR